MDKEELIKSIGKKYLISCLFLNLWQHAVELMEEEPGPAGEGVDSQAAEMDGYEADTEQLANTSPSSSK